MTDARFSFGGDEVPPTSDETHIHSEGCFDTPEEYQKYKDAHDSPELVDLATKMTALIRDLVSKVGMGIMENDNDQIRGVLATFRSFHDDDPKAFVKLCEAMLLTYSKFMVDKFIADTGGFDNDDNNDNEG